MAESKEDSKGMGDVFGVAETSVASSPGEIFHDRILDMIISRRRRERARTLNLTCKVLLKSVDESLSHDSALLLACNQGTLCPLEEQRKSGSFSLDRYLDIIQIRFGDSSIGTPYLLRPTPLTLALSRGHLSVAEYLIEQGADVNLPEDVSKVADDKSANPRRPLKWFPIHFASLLSRDLNREGDAVRVLEKLLARDASPDQQMIGWSPASHANTPLLQLLEGYVLTSYLFEKQVGKLTRIFWAQVVG